MGCDIHAHVEIKVSGRWEHWTSPQIDRWYALFTKMAGVRAVNDEIVPIAQPRGLPDNLSTVTRLAHAWRGSKHSESWLSRDEIYVLEEWWNTNAKIPTKVNDHFCFETEVMGNYLDGNGYFYSLPEDVEDVRLVFWFDN